MNELKQGKLTTEYRGLHPWFTHTDVHTCSVHHDFYPHFPVATFHNRLITFKPGYAWEANDLADLCLIYKQYLSELSRIVPQIEKLPF